MSISPNVDLGLLRTFLGVYRAGSITAAAAAVGLSQPTVTAHVRSLEAQLDQQLFRRLPRGVVPTAVADELAAEVAVHVDALSAVTERGPARAARFARPVHLAGPVELTTMRVVPALVDLMSRGLKLRVTVGLADELLAGLLARRFHIVISTVRPRGKAVVATPLIDEEFVLVAAPDWAGRIDPTVLDRDPALALRPLPLVAYAEDMPIIRRYWRTVFGVRPAGRPALVVPDLRGVLTAVVAGAGGTVLPRYVCDQELADGRLVALLEPEIPPLNTIYSPPWPGPTASRTSRPCTDGCSTRRPAGSGFG